MSSLLPHLPFLPPALLLVASLLLLRPFLKNPARIKALLAPRDLARPAVTLLDGVVVCVIGLFVLALNIAGNGDTSLDPSLLLLIGVIVATVLFDSIFLAPAAVIILFRRGASLAGTFGIRRETAWRDFTRGLRYGVMMLFPVFAVSIATHGVMTLLGFDPQAQNTLSLLGDEKLSLLGRLLFAATLFTFIPVYEEAAFRGVLLPAFARVAPWKVLIVCQAVFFGLIHFNAAAFPALFLVGLCLALGYARTGSLLTPIAMHAVQNFFAALASFAHVE